MDAGINIESLRERHRRAKRKEHPECDAWFELGGRSGSETFDLVSAACAAVSSQARASATVTGTFVQLFMPDWEEACTLIAQRLSEAGEDVRVGVPPIYPYPDRFTPKVLPCLVMAHRLDPPASTIPRFQRSQVHWRLTEAVQRRRLDRAAEWLTEPSRFAAVGGLRLMPASREDAAAKLESFFGSKYDTVFANAHDSAGSLSRQIVFRDWGESSWRGSYPGLSELERVERLTELLVEFAPDLELGAIRVCSTFDIGGGKFSQMYPLAPLLIGDPWGTTPQLWSAYVPDAHGVQVVNDEQLSKAHDLSEWHIETITPGHHLLTAADLSAWFERSVYREAPWPTPAQLDLVPTAATLEKARRDFGEMILTSDIAEDWVRDHLAGDA